MDLPTSSSPRRVRTLLVAATIAAGGLLASAVPAGAAAECEFGSVTRVLNVAMGADDDVSLAVNSDGSIAVGSRGELLACDGPIPTVTTANVVSIGPRLGASSNYVSIRGAGQFVPGAGTAGENGGDGEIEIFVNLNDDPDSLLAVTGGNSGARIRFGANGINPNATFGEVAPDTDIFLRGVQELIAEGGNGADVLDAQGGAGTGGPLLTPIGLYGGAGSDDLRGGEGPDTLTGLGGPDRIVGFGGDDMIRPGTGSDAMDGGLGTDTVDYTGNADGVSVNLAVVGPQAKGGGFVDALDNVENVFGTSHPDVLRGDDGPNRLVGVDGNDIIEGRGGPDQLSGGDGADQLDVRDGGPDIANCGPVDDVVTADLEGVDTLAQCEDINFVLPPPPPPAEETPETGDPEPTTTGGPEPATTGGGATATTGGGTTPTVPRDTSPPVFRGKARALPARFEVAKGTKFGYTLSEPATVGVTVERRTTGARVGRSCRRTSPAISRGRRCVLFRRVGSFRVAATLGANRTPFSGRIGSKTLTPGSYRARFTAVDAAGNASGTTSAGFQVRASRARRAR